MNSSVSNIPAPRLSLADRRLLHLSGVTKRVYCRNRWWHGEFSLNGQTYEVPLKLPVDGLPGSSIKDEGDLKFELSREAARAKLNLMVAYYRDELEAGRKPHWRYANSDRAKPVADLQVEKLVEAWEASYNVQLAPVPGRPARKVKQSKNERYHLQVKRKLEALVAMLKNKNPDVKRVKDIRREHIDEFMAQQWQDHVGVASTYNKILTAVRGAFNRLIATGAVEANPCARVPLVVDDLSIDRESFTENEITRLLSEAKQSDPIIYTLMLVIISTAMREVNACPLAWSSIHLPDTIEVVPAKKGNPVAIPIFPPLFEVLTQAAVEREKETDPERRKSVFPDLAEIQENRPWELMNRFYEVAVRAGFSRDQLQKNKPGRKRAASVLGLHSLRTSFISHALAANVAPQTIQLITGHTSSKMVTTVYNRQRAEMIRPQFANMPACIVGKRRPSAPTERPVMAEIDARTRLTAFVECLDAVPEEIAATQPDMLRVLDEFTQPAEVVNKLRQTIFALTPSTLETFRLKIRRLIQQLV